MPAISYSDHARAILALPGTAENIAERCGMTARGVTIMFRRMWSLDLVHPGGAELGPSPHSGTTAVWIAGPGERAAGIRLGTPMRPLASHIAFASIWQELQDGATIHGIAEETGTSHVTVYRLLADLRRQGAVRIVGYERDAVNRNVAVWALGRGQDVRKRLVTPSEKHRRYRERLSLKPLAMLALAGAENDRSAEAVA
jgi:hypothetical protein